MDQALQRAIDNGVKNLVIQPTHLMHGAEYDEMMASVDAVSDKFESVKVAEPLLGPAAEDINEINADKVAVADAAVDAAAKDAGYESAQAAADDGVAFVFLGHGTAHEAKVAYTQMQNQMTEAGYTNAFVGTVEGEPEETSVDAVAKAVADAGYTKVILRPLMVVAGDHANNDMAGEDEDSWKSVFEASGNFDSVEAQIAGLGSIPAVQDIYLAHTAAVLAE